MLRTLALTGTAALLLAGCRNDGPMNVTPADFAGTASTDMATPQDGMPAGSDMAALCAGGYTDTTIAAMRAAQTFGCFRVGMMAPVVSLATVASSKNGTIAVQDSAGGDSSAIVATCATKATGTYICSAAGLAAFGTVTVGHGTTLSGVYAYSAKYQSEDFHLLDQAVIDSGAAVTAPTPLAVNPADVAFGATTLTRAKYFQKVSVTLGANTMKVYEFAPPQYKPSGTWPGCSSLPYTFGFGVIPSTSSATAGAACTITTPVTAPMPVSAQDPGEVLVDTTFYKTFSKSSDCECTTMATDLVTAGQAFTTFGGLLNLNTGGAAPFLEIVPTADADFGL
jgi:hypothetical protein